MQVSQVTMVTLVLMTTGAAAQTPPAPDRAAAEQLQARYQIGVMERALEQAVQLGAHITGRQLPTVTPNLLLFSSPPRARGFKLEGYGLFFDVEVPALRRSVMWSMRTLAEADLGVSRALDSLREHVESVRDTSARTSLEQALRRIELQVGPLQPVGAEGADRQPEAAADAVAPRQLAEEPGQAYTTEVRRALISAMLDYGGPLPLADAEWLTVAARDNEDRLTPAEMYDVLTLVLRIRGGDLAALRAGRLTREQAIERVEVSEF